MARPPLPERLPERLTAVAGVLGPAAFVGAWLLGGALLPGYDPVSDPISRLAREGASTAPLMTGGFVAFGVLLPAFAVPLARATRAGAGAAGAASGLATLAVAALPLSAAGGQPVDTRHAVAAGAGYAAQVLAPLLGARAFTGRARQASYAVSATALACLVGSLAAPPVTGLLQRAGLTVVDAWFAVVAVRLLRRASRPGVSSP